MQLTRRIAVSAAIGAAIAIALLGWWLQREGSKNQATQAASAAVAAVAPSSASSAAAARPASPASPPREPDPIGHAPDLRAVHDRLRASADPAERRIARRAFGTCIPAFLPAAGQPVSAEPLVRSLPADAQRSEREAAWRDLFARCQRFGGEARDALMQENAGWRRDAESADPAARALVAARAGRLDEAGSLVAAISPADPASIDTLGGIARLLARNRDADDRDLALRAAAVDTALPLVACDLGLSCDAQSLRALELCAVEAACQGDVAARILARAGVDPALADAAQRERTRLATLIRANGRISLGDLLP